MGVLNTLKYCVYGVIMGVPVGGVMYNTVGGVGEISGRSMRPTLNPDDARTCDKVWISRWGLNKYHPLPGDVVTLISPIEPLKKIVKRVIAIEGDVIRNTRSKHVQLVRIPRGHVWVEGDNTGFSQDSSYFGPVSIGLICGRATHIVWPPNRWASIRNTIPSHQANKVCTDQDITELDTGELSQLNNLNRYSIQHGK